MTKQLKSCTLIINQLILNKKVFTQSERDRIVEMAWEDRTPFEAIYEQFGIKEAQVRKIMRSEMKSSSFKMWRERVSGRKTKHQNYSEATRFKSVNQKD